MKTDCQGNRTCLIADAAPPPGPGEDRLDVARAGICGTDIQIYHGAMETRVKPPQIIGHDMSGTVAEIGPGVTGLAVGDTELIDCSRCAGPAT